MVVYPLSANFPTLNNDWFNFGRTWTSFTALGTCSNGSIAFFVARIFDPSGRKTFLVDGVVVGMKCPSERPKCDVAPESTIIDAAAEHCDIAAVCAAISVLLGSSVSNVTSDSGVQ